MNPLSMRVMMFLALGLSLLTGQMTGTSKVIHVGVILDGPSARNTWILREFEQQLTGFFVPEYDVRFEPEFTVTADWTVAGIRSGIDKLLSYPDVEIVLALGVVSSHEIAHRTNLSKPVIAAF